MTTSSERAPETVLRGESARAVSPLVVTDLRGGEWTRLGDQRVWGDPATESVLAGLARETREAARDQGYAAGWAEGRRAAAARALREAEDARLAAEYAERRRAAAHATALAALERAAADLSAATARADALLLEQALRVARELTEAVLGHELRTAETAADAVARALAAVGADGTGVTVRLHPDTLTPDATAALAAHGVRVQADPGLEPGDAVVETETTVVDRRIAGTLARVREALS